VVLLGEIGTETLAVHWPATGREAITAQCAEKGQVRRPAAARPLEPTTDARTHTWLNDLTSGRHDSIEALVKDVNLHQNHPPAAPRSISSA
jgi:hypothetical protein